MNKETEIITDLRTIKIEYESNAELCEFEINLIEKYKNLHNEYAFFSKEIEQFEKDYNNITTILEEAKEKFNIVKQLSEEVLSYHKKKFDENDKQEIKRVDNLVIEYNNKNREAILFIQNMCKTCNELSELHKKLYHKDEDIEKQHEEFNDLKHELFQNYKNYNISIIRFDKDDNEFKESLGKYIKNWNQYSNNYIEMLDDNFNPLIKEYNALIEHVEKNKHIRPVTVKIPHESDSFPFIKDKKQYFIKPGSPKISQYADILTKAAKAGKGILVNVEFNAIEKKNIAPIVDIIMVSQHKKSWIENIIFKMHIRIVNIPSTEPESINSNIFTSKKVIAYFAELGKNPLVFFFMDKIDISMMALSADKISKSELDIKKEIEDEDDEEEAMLIGYDDKQVQEFFDKFFQACIQFHKYCDETGVDTRKYIEEAITGLRNGFGFEEKVKTFTYEDVLEHYEKIKSLPFPLNNN